MLQRRRRKKRRRKTSPGDKSTIIIIVRWHISVPEPRKTINAGWFEKIWKIQLRTPVPLKEKGNEGIRGEREAGGLRAQALVSQSGKGHRLGPMDSCGRNGGGNEEVRGVRGGLDSRPDINSQLNLVRQSPRWSTHATFCLLTTASENRAFKYSRANCSTVWTSTNTFRPWPERREVKILMVKVLTDINIDINFSVNVCGRV